MTKQIAFVVPIYPPHYKFARKLIESWRANSLDSQSDIWFVFTDENEKAEFDEWDFSIVLPEGLRNFANNGMINIKKFYGLSQIKDKYEWAIVLDAESAFVRNIDLKKVCETYWEARTLYGNNTIPMNGGGEWTHVKPSSLRASVFLKIA